MTGDRRSGRAGTVHSPRRYPRRTGEDDPAGASRVGAYPPKRPDHSNFFQRRVSSSGMYRGYSAPSRASEGKPFKAPIPISFAASKNHTETERGLQASPTSELRSSTSPMRREDSGRNGDEPPTGSIATLPDPSPTVPYWSMKASYQCGDPIPAPPPGVRPRENSRPRTPLVSYVSTSTSTPQITPS